MHFFFGAFASILEDDEAVEKELLFNPSSTLPT